MSTTHRWSGDLLGRHEFGDFLYNFIVNRYESQVGHEATCCAIDGDWGEGKTFFITKWAQDIEGKQHPVILFDAWKNDHHQDPLLSFISHINNALKPLIAKSPKGPIIAEKLKKSATKICIQAGKAAIPLAAAGAKNYAKRVVGEEGGEILEGIIKTDGPIISDKDIEKFLERSFKDYATKNSTIEKVKIDLEKLAIDLENLGGFRAPIFIIIDELDRCRPDYALSLLEGVKHILSAKGIAFVISTNITQLAASVKAVYGQEFDGRKYLRRFFDFDYQLPERSSIDYIKNIISQSTLSNSKFIHSGLYSIDGWNNKEISPEECINDIIDYFSLDLRSAKQIITKAECFIALQPKHEKTNLSLLISLCCLDVVDEDAISSLIKNPEQHLTKFIKKSGRIAKYTIGTTSSTGEFSRQERTIATVIDFYQHMSTRAMNDIKRIGNPNCYESNILELVPQDSSINPLSKYGRQIKKMTTFSN